MFSLTVSPDERIFQTVLDKLDTAASKAVMFGDNAITDGACKRLGVVFVYVTAYSNDKWVWEKGKKHRPDYTMNRIDVQSIADLFSHFALKKESSQ